MGLDQHAYSISVHDADLLDSQEYLDGDLAIESEEELMYWRKHPDLEGFMATLYADKGGEDTFNCKRVWLEEEDLLLLKSMVEKHELPTATGFFWGVSTSDDDAPTLEFIEKAMTALKEGKMVYYTSWW